MIFQILNIQKTEFCQVFLNNYFEELTNRSISNFRSFRSMSENQNKWWVGLPKELQKDIELEK
jgi:hypothetical protein